MLKSLGILIALTLIGYLWWSGEDEGEDVGEDVGAKRLPREENANSEQAPSGKKVRTVSRWTLPEPGEVRLAPIANMAEQLNAAGQGAHEDLIIVDQLLTYYRKVFGENPVGLNSEVVLRLAGRNSKNLAVLPPDHPAIDVRGRLLDRWGTPLFFHQVSGTKTEITSAGADRELHTGDDVALRP